MRLSRAFALGAAALSMAGLAACQPAPTVTGGDFAASVAALRAQGFLRTERNPADAPVTNADLVRNFERIAFGLEPRINRGRSRVDALARWDEPVRWRLHATGPEAPAAAADVARTFSRIAAATRADLAAAPAGARANVDILFLGPEDYEHEAARRARPGSGAGFGAGHASLVRAFRPATMPCAAHVRGLRVPGPGGDAYALVLIRKGLGDAYRLSCVEEELAQIMGLGNDDPRVRPSAFNDDEEFALLTTHDEMLLRIPYDPRLRAGMTVAETMPLVARIADELRPGG